MKRIKNVLVACGGLSRLIGANQLATHRGLMVRGCLLPARIDGQGLPLPALLVLAALAPAGADQRVGVTRWENPHGPVRSCGTVNPTNFQPHPLETAPLAVSAPVTIQVYWHVIHNGAVGQLSATNIEDSIAVLNASFGGGTGGAATRFQFALASTDYTDNANWFDNCDQLAVEAAMKTALRVGNAASLNIYSCSMTGSGLLGWGTLPEWYAGNPTDDGVVILYGTVPSGWAYPYHEGDILVHDVGHWLGLYDTFEGGCTGSGDGVDDTARKGPRLWLPDWPRHVFFSGARPDH